MGVTRFARRGASVFRQPSELPSPVPCRLLPWLPLLLIGLALVGGCGSGASDEDLGSAENAVRAGLDAWKRGEQPAALKQLAAPIEFHDDDWLAGAKLMDFELTQTFRDNDGKPRCEAKLTLEFGGGKQESKTVIYEANLDGGIVVGRDPMS